MLIFLGDSINLGVELVQETGELTPESFDHKTKIKNYWNPKLSRLDLAFPELMSQELKLDYVTLAQGGATYAYSLRCLQKYIAKENPPKGSTVFLNTAHCGRAYLVDAGNMGIEHQVFWEMPATAKELGRKAGFTIHESTLEMLDKPGVLEFLQRITPYYNLQALRHIRDTCKIQGYNFLFCEIFEDLYSGSQDMDPSPSKQIADLQPHEIFNSDKFKNNPDYMYGGHVSILGNQEVAKDLCAWYRENIC